MIKKSKTCMESEMKKLSTPAKKKKYPNPKQRVAIGLNVCGLSKYEDGGLIAPNGKKSNLTPEQYKLVRTPAFKKWFGDWENDPEKASKVVDENGEPLICYHATNEHFTEFLKNKRIEGRLGKGFYFTSSKNEANSYGNIIMECFLKVDELYNGRTMKTNGKGNFFGIEYTLTTNGGRIFMVDNPKQIKLADGRNTAFDSRNPDIRFDNGGEIKNKLDLYQVTLNFEDDIETIYVGNDKKKAYDKYENFNPKTDIETKYQDRNDIFLILQKSTQTYKFVYDLDEDESVEDYPLEDYFDEDYYWKLIDEGDWEDIETKDILAVNKKSDNLLKEVEEYYKKKYGKYKYNTINIEDSEETYRGCIQLRVANHSENVGNIDRFGNCNYYISVVIADYDATKEKFEKGRRSNEIELYFDTDSKLDEVINEVDSQIAEFRENILDEYEQGGEIKNNWGLNNLIYWWK